MGRFWKHIYHMLAEMLAKPEMRDKRYSVGLSHEIDWTGYSRDDDEREQRNQIVEWALEQEGKLYEFGKEVQFEEEVDTIDCSELTENAYNRAGLEMPDGSWAQYEFCRPTAKPKPGDLGFLWSEKRGQIGHVEMFTGGTGIIGAVGGKVGRVRETSVSWLEEHTRFRGWRRHPEFQHDDSN